MVADRSLFSCHKYFLDVAVVIGGEIDSAHGFKAVATVSTVSTKCGLFNSSLPDMPEAKKAGSATFLDNKYDILIFN